MILRIFVTLDDVYITVIYTSNLVSRVVVLTVSEEETVINAVFYDFRPQWRPRRREGPEGVRFLGGSGWSGRTAWAWDRWVGLVIVQWSLYFCIMRKWSEVIWLFFVLSLCVSPCWYIEKQQPSSVAEASWIVDQSLIAQLKEQYRKERKGKKGVKSACSSTFIFSPSLCVGFLLSLCSLLFFYSFSFLSSFLIFLLCHFFASVFYFFLLLFPHRTKPL